VTHLEAIRAVLGRSTVFDLVGGAIFPLTAPQGLSAPYVVITTVSAVPTPTFEGAPANLLETARVQVDAYSKTYIEAHTIADAVDAAIGGLADAGLSAVRVNQTDLYDDETELYRVSTDFSVLR
jgi:hypothetical protein